jgi:hypothetical protein
VNDRPSAEPKRHDWPQPPRNRPTARLCALPQPAQHRAITTITISPIPEASTPPRAQANSSAAIGVVQVTNVIEIYNAPRGKAGRIAIPRWLMSSPIWYEASLETKACFVEIAALFDGNNNGKLPFGVRAAGWKLGISRARARKALADLQSLGLAEDLSDGERKPATWRLAHLYCNVTGKPAIMPWRSAAQQARQELAHRTYPWTGEQVHAVVCSRVLIDLGDTQATDEDKAYADAASNWFVEAGADLNCDVDLEPGAEIYSTIAGYLTEHKVAHAPLGFSSRTRRAA